MDADKLKIQKIESFLKQFQSYIALIIIVVVATLINIKDGENVFLSVPNLMNVLRAVSEIGIIGMFPAVLLSLLIGALYGLFNGLCVTKLKLQAFIVTLASMNIARGLARFWSNGVGIPLAYGEGEGFAPPAFGLLQEKAFGVIPAPVIIFISLLLIFQCVLSKTSFVRKVYAI